MAKWISLQKTDTGFVFATNHSLPLSEQWPWISETVAHEFHCDAYDLNLTDDEDGEFVALNGEAIVRIHNCRMVNEARPLVQLDRVA